MLLNDGLTLIIFLLLCLLFDVRFQFDKNCWVAITALCEMGVAIDTEAIFGISLTAALQSVQANQVSVASVHSLDTSTSTKTKLESKAAGGGLSKQSGDVLKFQRGHVMERRHIAEHLGDPKYTPPNTAMSLGMLGLCVSVGRIAIFVDVVRLRILFVFPVGMSALALHVGFATPGCMPSPQQSFNMSNMQQFMVGEDPVTGGTTTDNGGKSMHSFSNYSNTALMSAMGGAPGSNGYRTVNRSGADGVGNNLFASPDSLLHMSINSHERLPSVTSHDRPGILFDTPGLTPISGGRLSVDGGVLGMNESAFPMSIDRHSNNSSGLTLPPPPEHDDPDSHALPTARLGAGGDDGAGRGRGGGRRRVSFGPSTVDSSPPTMREIGGKKKIAARLSFSSAGKEIPDEAYEDEDSEYTGQRTDNAPPEKFQRIKDEDDDYNFDTPCQYLQQEQRQPTQPNILSTPHDVAQDLYDRVQRQDTEKSHGNTVIKKPIRTVGKASRIPVPSRSKSPQFSEPVTGRLRDSTSPTPHAHITPTVKSPGTSRPAAGRGVGRSTDAKGNTSSYKSKESVKEQRGEVDLNERKQLLECWEAGQASVYSILSVFGQAYNLMCQFQCTECIRHLQLLPRRHFSSGWVQHILGKAYFELNDYKVIFQLAVSTVCICR